jgi:hypothetical protein
MREWRYSYTILTSVLDGSELSASRHDRFTPGGRAPGIHCIGGWVGPRAGLDNVEKRKMSYPCWESNCPRPACSLSLYRLSFPGSGMMIVAKIRRNWEKTWSSVTSFTNNPIWSHPVLKQISPEASVSLPGHGQWNDCLRIIFNIFWDCRALLRSILTHSDSCRPE